MADLRNVNPEQASRRTSMFGLPHSQKAQLREPWGEGQVPPEAEGK